MFIVRTINSHISSWSEKSYVNIEIKY